MRLGFDLRIHRYPPGRTTVYADVIMTRMAAGRADSWDVVPVEGWPRLSHASRIPAAIRQGANLGLDLGWISVGGAASAARGRFSAWLAPAIPLAVTIAAPSVVVVHGIDYVVYPHLYPRGFARVAELLARATLRRAARIAAASDYVRDTVIERFGVSPDKVTTVRWGLDHLPDAVPERLHDAPYALFVGQPQPVWNVDVLIDAWSAGAGRDLDLVISGPSGRDEGRIRRRIENEGLSQRVHFTGHLPTERLMALMRDAAIFVYPARADDRGLAPLESMLYGVPTAVADRGALPEVTKGAALTFDPEDLDAVIDVITRLREDEELRARLRRDGPPVARALHWADTAAGLWREVDEAMAG